MDVTFRSEAGRSLRGGTVAGVRDIFGHLELFQMLLIKDLKIRYKASAIGLFWSLLNPLLMMVVYTAIFGALFRSQRPQFPIFILSGLLAWSYFGAALPTATISIVGSANLVKKSRFPTSLLPLSVVGSGLINYLISMALLVGLMLFYGHSVGPSILWLPVLVVAQVAFTAGLGLLLSALNVLFRDVEHFVGILLTVWFFATPIIYPRELIGASKLGSLILDLNPMAWLIAAYQSILYGHPESRDGGRTFYGVTPSWPELLPTVEFISLAALTLVIGFVVFQRLSRRFAEEV